MSATPDLSSPYPKPLSPPGPAVWDLWRDSLLLGLVGFGGGISVLGIIQSLAVVRRRWLSEREFATTATIAQMLPGGAAANALAAIGLRFHGVLGAAVAYLGFVLPGAAIILALGYVYVRFGAVADAGAFFSGMNAAVVGVILAIAVRMSRAGIGRLWQMAVAVGALVLALVGGAGSGEVVLLGIAIGLSWDLARRARVLRRHRTRGFKRRPRVALPEEGSPLQAPAAEPPKVRATLKLSALAVLAVATPLIASYLGDLASLAVVFFRTGLGAYGGGFAVIPTLHAQVAEHQWLTDRQFADAVAVGKLTPGPVLLMATFIGFLKGGLAGALVATAAILAAPFILVVTMAGWLVHARSSRWVRAALSGLTPSVVGLMVAAAMTLGASIRTGVGGAIAAAVAMTLIRFERVNPVVMLALGGAARLLYRLATGI